MLFFFFFWNLPASRYLRHVLLYSVCNYPRVAWGKGKRVGIAWEGGAEIAPGYCGPPYLGGQLDPLHILGSCARVVLDEELHKFQMTIAPRDMI